MKKICVWICVIGLFITGCSKTNEEIESRNSTAGGGTTTTCDTVNMKYAANIQSIIQANCYSCHGNGNAEGGISLDTYNKLQQRASTGLLLNVITHATGYPAMPYQKARLSDCDINKIRDWVNRGYQNN
jgi:cytochrome c553